MILPAHRLARRSTRSLLVAAALVATVTDVRANPSGAAVVHGAAAMQQLGSELQITNAAGTIIDWQAFSIGTGETTRFVQPTIDSAVLNRVVGGDASEILGQLLSNGQVFLVNPNGVLFGGDAVVDTAGFVASTLPLTNEDFLAGEFVFGGEGASGGRIVNQGTLTGRGGHLWFIAPEIENSGVILAENGSLTLAAGSEVRIASLDTPGIDYLIRAPEHEIVNLGSLLAEQGTIRAFAGSLRHEGVIAADTVSVDDDGTIVISASGDIDLAAGSSITTTGGDVTVWSETGTALIAGTIDASDAAGTGGTIRLLGDRVGLVGDGEVRSDGGVAGGTVLVGGNLRGAGPEPNAARTFVGPEANVSASGVGSGDGGTVIAYGSELLRVRGQLAAAGGETGGRGGFVETSTQDVFDVDGFPDVSSIEGGGEWLIDPDGLLVTDVSQGGNAADLVGVPGVADFTVPAGNANDGLREEVLTSDIAGVMTGGVTVTIDATAGGASPPTADILWDGLLVLDSITNGSNNELRLIAPNVVTFNGGIDDFESTLSGVIVNADNGLVLNSGAFIDSPFANIDVLDSANALPADLLVDGGSISAGFISVENLELSNGADLIYDGLTATELRASAGLATIDNFSSPPMITQLTIDPGAELQVLNGLFVEFIDLDGTLSGGGFVDVQQFGPGTSTLSATGSGVLSGGVFLSITGLTDLVQGGDFRIENGAELALGTMIGFTQSADIDVVGAQLTNDSFYTVGAAQLRLDGSAIFTNNGTVTQNGGLFVSNTSSVANFGPYDQNGIADFNGSFLTNEGAGDYSQSGTSTFDASTIVNEALYDQNAPLTLIGSNLVVVAPTGEYTQSNAITLQGGSNISNGRDYFLAGDIVGDGSGSLSNQPGALLFAETPTLIDAAVFNDGIFEIGAPTTLARGGSNFGDLLLSENSDLLTTGQLSLQGPDSFFIAPGGSISLGGLNDCQINAISCVDVGPGSFLDVGESVTIPNLTIDSGFVFIAPGVTLQAPEFSQFGGTVGGDGTLAISGLADIDGVATHSGNGTTDILSGASLTVAGPELRIFDGRFFRIGAGATAEIPDGATLFLDGNPTLLNEGTTTLRGFASVFGPTFTGSTFRNTGLLIKTDPGETVIEGGFFENVGDFDLQGGNVRMRADAAFRDGSIFNGTRTNFEFDGGFHRIEEGATFGTGFALRFGTLELVDDPLIPGAFTLTVDDVFQEQSSIQGAGLTITNAGTFNGGDHSGPGTTRFAPTATIDQLDLAVLGGRSIVNEGLISTPFLSLFNDGESTATFVNDGAGPRGIRLIDAGFAQIDQIEFTNNGDFTVLPNPMAMDPNQQSSFLGFNGGSFTNSIGATFTLTGAPSFDPVEDVFGGGVFVRFNQGSTFTNLGSLQGSDVDIQATNGSTLVSSGVLEITRTLDVPPPDPFSCCSSVQITGGSDATLSGVLQFGLLNLTRGSTVQLDGSLALNALNVTTVPLPGPNGVPIATQTVLSGTGDLSVSDSFSLTGGILRLDGTVTILDGAGVNVGPERPESISAFPSVIDGTVVLQNSNGPTGSDAVNVLAGDLRLVNGGEFRNSGTLFVDNTFTDAVADGVQDFDGIPITASAPSLVTLTQTAGTTFTNSGLIETRNGTPLRIEANFANAGTLSARAGDIGVVGGLQLGGTGLLGAAAGATIRVAQFQQSGGQVAGAGTFAIAGSGTMTGGTNTIDTLVVEAGADFTAGPALVFGGTRTLRNAGAATFASLGLAGGATIDLAADSTTAVTDFQQSGGTLLGAGGVAVSGTGTLSGGDFGAGSASFGVLQLGGDARLGLAPGTTTSVGTLTQTGGTISGPGTLTLSGSGSVSGGTNTAGTTNVLSGATLTVTSPFALAGGRTLQNAGSASFAGLALGDSATLNVGTGATTTVATFSQTGGAVTGPGALEIQGTGTISGGANSVAVTRIAPGATLTATNAFALNGTRALRNAGSASFATLGVADSAVLDLAAGSTTTVGTLAVATPSLTLNGALSAQQFEITSPTLTISESGALGGIGTITGDVLNGGTLAPGNSPGTISIDGDFTQSETGRLVIEVGGAGTTAGTDFDQLNVSGSATLGGTLEVTALPDYTGALGSDFTPITYASTSGTFATVTQTTPGTTFDLEFGPNGVRSQLTERDGETAETGFDPQDPPETVADREQAREFADQALEGCPEERDEVDGTNATTREQESPESATAAEGETPPPDSAAQGGQGVGCTTG